MIDFDGILGQMGGYIPLASHQSVHGLIVYQWLIPLIGFAFFGLLFVCVYRAAKFFEKAGNEQKLLRIEMGKLAEEMHLMRRETKGDKSGEHST